MQKRKKRKPSPAENTRAERIVSFINRLQDSMFTVNGKPAFRTDTMTELVAEDPDIAAGAVFALLRGADEFKLKGHRQLALAVAGIYQNQTGDDGLSRRVERALKAAGEKPPNVLSLEENGEVGPAEARSEGFVLQITPDMLESGDIYNILRLFRIGDQDAEDLKRLREMRGRCLMLFDLDEDPRSVWQIPEARALIRKLFDEMPYFPYFLNMEPEAGSFMLFFGCLADPEEAFDIATDQSIEDLGGRWKQMGEALRKLLKLRRRQGLLIPPGIPEKETVVYINCMHPSVAEHVLESAVHIALLCRAWNEDPEPVLSALMAPYPQAMRRELISGIEEQLRVNG